MIGVVVPSFNYACFLGECLDSLLECRPHFDEIVVVDDASSDSTPLIAEAYADYAVRYVRNDVRRGIVWNLNTYLPELRSEWVCMVSADDWVRPDFVACHEDVLANHAQDPKLAIVYSGARYTVTHWPTERPELDGAVIGIEPWNPERLEVLNYIHGSAVIRRSVIADVGGFPEVEVEEDHAMWRKIAAAGYRGIGIPRVLLNYRQHDRGHRNYRTDHRRADVPRAEWE